MRPLRYPSLLGSPFSSPTVPECPAKLVTSGIYSPPSCLRTGCLGGPWPSQARSNPWFNDKEMPTCSSSLTGKHRKTKQQDTEDTWSPSHHVSRATGFNHLRKCLELNESLAAPEQACPTSRTSPSSRDSFLTDRRETRSAGKTREEETCWVRRAEAMLGAMDASQTGILRRD